MSEAVKPPRANQKVFLVAGITLALLVLLGIGYLNTSKQPPVAGAAAPELAMSFYDGYEWDNRTTASLSDMQGEVVLLNFWASWCIPCVEEAPILEAVWRDYADQGVIFLGVAWSDTDPKAFEFLQEHDITYPNAPDLQLRAESAYRFPRVPETFIIDRDGVIVQHKPGIWDEAELRSALDEVLDN